MPLIQRRRPLGHHYGKLKSHLERLFPCRINKFYSPLTTNFGKPSGTSPERFRGIGWG